MLLLISLYFCGDSINTLYSISSIGFYICLDEYKSMFASFIKYMGTADYRRQLETEVRSERVRFRVYSVEL